MQFATFCQYMMRLKALQHVRLKPHGAEPDRAVGDSLSAGLYTDGCGSTGAFIAASIATAL